MASGTQRRTIRSIVCPVPDSRGFEDLKAAEAPRMRSTTRPEFIAMSTLVVTVKFRPRKHPHGKILQELGLPPVARGKQQLVRLPKAPVRAHHQPLISASHSLGSCPLEPTPKLADDGAVSLTTAGARERPRVRGPSHEKFP